MVEDGKDGAVAVVGLGCRVPGADTIDALWRLLDERRDEITPVPGHREPLYTEVTAADSRATGAQWGGFLAELESWDPGFFGISPSEAARIDPQQALALEVAWRALESAGVVQADLLGSRTGVFFGQATHDHAMLLSGQSTHEMQGPYTNPGLSHAITANRLSYLWDLRGPSMTVDTACSSSLVAVHLAVQSLRSGECDLAIAGGVNALLSPVPQLGAAGLTALAADGRCRTFDASGRGYVRSEGGGAVVLRRLEDALASGEHIHVVIKGSGVNQDGRTNGLTAPSGRAQTELIVQSLRQAGVRSAKTLGYVELHGTGTPLGDPIEGRALGAALDRAVGKDRPPLPVGSIKANIGHLEAAAGVLGLIKAALVLRHGVVPGNPHLREVNPRIDLDGFGLAMSDGHIPLPADASAVAVSSFGFGGTNASVVLARAPHQQSPVQVGARANSGPVVLPLSARSAQSLAATVSDWADWLGSIEDWEDVRQAARAASAHRTAFEWRAGVVAASRQELLDQLTSIRDGTRDAPHTRTGTSPSLGFVYSGHGSQWDGMGRELLGACPPFGERVREVDAVLAPMLGWSPLAALEGTESADLDDIRVAQPLIFTVQLALTAQLASLGIQPDAVTGHSMGELSAAVVAGRLELATACRVLRARNDAVDAARGTGGMAVVEGGAHEAAEILAQLGSPVTVAADNSPRSCVLSGHDDALTAALAEFERRGRDTRRVKVDYPSHGPLMEAPAEQLGRVLGSVDAPEPGSGPAFYSSVHGRSYEAPLDARYWQDNLTHPVRARGAVTAMADDGVTHVLEISPHPVLLVALRESLEAQGEGAVALSTGHRDQRGDLGLREVEATLFERGLHLRADADAVTHAWASRLPVHHFRRTHVYRVPAAEPADRTKGVSPGILTEASFQPGTYLAGLTLPETRENHLMAGEPAVSVAELVAAALWSAREAGVEDAAFVQDLEMHRPLPADPSVPRQLVVHLGGNGSRPARSAAVRFLFRRAGRWTTAASCTVGVRPLAPLPDVTATVRCEVNVPAPPPTASPASLASVLDRALPAVARALLAERTDIDPELVAVSRVGAVHASAELWTADGAVAEGQLRECDGEVLMDLAFVSTAGNLLAQVQHMALAQLSQRGGTDDPEETADIGSGGRAQSGGELRQTLLSLPSDTERRQALGSWLHTTLDSVLPNGLREGATDDLSFAEMGLESLMGVEMRNRLEKELDIRLSATLVWAHPTIRQLADALLGRIVQETEQTQQVAPGAAQDAMTRPGAAGSDALSQLLAELDG
ncbi:acyltransferase domain-containing protein [Streptomyces phaeochromogenes]|uniref:type I polyketide synthase n=1 Tax=Streptomyces phaeochromogenes TaxID=1923 RepID=UPI002250D6F8|nr:beta-ketoacyl synthase N-terminal-like domain-containing protein [Streptomyces phaeochromogenes]MCX5601233.1 acyltransferase domain-containing protein [Streptomyces phaeochromogenes]